MIIIIIHSADRHHAAQDGIAQTLTVSGNANLLVYFSIVGIRIYIKGFEPRLTIYNSTSSH